MWTLSINIVCHWIIQLYLIHFDAKNTIRNSISSKYWISSKKKCVSLVTVWLVFRIFHKKITFDLRYIECFTMYRTSCLYLNVNLHSSNNPTLHKHIQNFHTLHWQLFVCMYTALTGQLDGINNTQMNILNLP